MNNTVSQEQLNEINMINEKKEQMIKWMKEQIEFKKVEAELQELNTKIAVMYEQQVKSTINVAQIKASTQPPKTQKHTLTEEDFDRNEGLKEQGFNVGDEVEIPVS